MSAPPDPAATDAGARARRRESAWHRRAWRRLRAWHAQQGRVLRIASLAAIPAAVAIAFVLLGGAPVAASAGHSAVVAWLLHFSYRRAVAVRSRGVETPPLDDPGLVARGAGHYASYCVACHGAPGHPRALLVRHMTPAPPVLGAALLQWSPRELHWIVMHGVKYTAMPAWIARQREDEVWAVVAFLRVLPSLDAARYRSLAYGEVAREAVQSAGALARPSAGASFETQLANCTRCHGTDGLGRTHGVAPKLAGQSAAYLESALRAYRSGRRPSGIMQPVAADLDDELVRRLAAHYAALPGGVGSPGAVGTALPGRRLVYRGVPENGVPACVGCHASEEPRHPEHRCSRASTRTTWRSSCARSATASAAAGPVRR